MIDQATSLRERDVTDCIISGHAGISKELLVTASDASKRLVLWRLLLEYINLIILRIFYGKLCACANSVYQAVFFGLGTRLASPTLKGLQSYLHHCNPYLPLNGELQCMYMSNYISHSPAACLCPLLWKV